MPHRESLSFLSANRREPGRVALLGVPMDHTTSWRPGTRFGPDAIRAASRGLEEYSPVLDRDLDRLDLADLGDVALPPGDLPGALLAVREAAAEALTRHDFLFSLGGEHLVTLPLVAAVRQRWPDLVVLQWDAHADLRDQLAGNPLSHASVLRRVAEELGPGRVVQIGPRSLVREEEAFAAGHTRLFPVDRAWPAAAADLGAALLAARPYLGGVPVYLTIDIDVADPAYAPGTGSPEPGGVAPSDLLGGLYQLAEWGVRVVGGDLVEVSPPQDPGGITALLAAKLIREALLALAWEGSLS